jgi:LPXTG-motif cell wall-anchored protein
MTPPEGTKVTFNLFANGVDQNKPVVLNGKVDVTTLSDDPEVAATQEEKANAVAANAYEKEAWQAYWGALPTHDAAGNPMTYTVQETAVSGYENLNPGGVSSGGTITNKRTDTEINVIKVDKADGTTPLIGAKFKLAKYDEGWHQVIQEWEEKEVSAEPGKEGTLSFEGLTIGKYELIETESPAGYVKTSEMPRFEVVADSEGNLTVSFEDTDMVTYDNGLFTVKNEPGAALPNTGGPGTRLFTILGSILILGAGVLLWMRQRLI